MKHTKYICGVFIITLVMTVAQIASASSACTFTRFLSMGDEGEDVLCLQKYLNSTEFRISESGVGSPGNETTRLGSLTKLALTKWQTKHGLLPATGYFGPGSTALYKKSVASTSTSTSIIVSTSTTTNQRANATETSLLKAIEAVERAVNKVDGLDIATDKTKAMKEKVIDVQSSLINAMRLYISGDYEKVKSMTDTLHTDAQKLISDADGDIDNTKIDVPIVKVNSETNVIKKVETNVVERKVDTNNPENLIKNPRRTRSDI